MAKILVYQIKNLVNGKIYIGMTRRGLDDRRYKHFYSARHGAGYRIHAAIRKYGEDNFEFSIVKICATLQEALDLEISTISLLKPAYNVTTGGEGVHGLIYTPEQRARMGESARGNKYWVGRKHRPESLEKMSRSLTGRIGPWAGKKRPPETCEKFRQAKLKNPTRYWLGKKRDAATIAKLQAGRKAKFLTGVLSEKEIEQRCVNMRAVHQRQKKPVYCLNDGRFFESGVVAAEFYGIKQTSVSVVCIGKKKSMCGLTFRFANAENRPNV